MNEGGASATWPGPPPWWAVLGRERPGQAPTCPVPGCIASPGAGALHCPEHEVLLGIGLDVGRFTTRWWLVMATRVAAVSVFPYAARLRSPILLELLGLAIIVTSLWLLGRQFRQSLRTLLVILAIVGVVGALTMVADNHRKTSPWMATWRDWGPAAVVTVAALVLWYAAVRNLRTRLVEGTAAHGIAACALGGLLLLGVGVVLRQFTPQHRHLPGWLSTSINNAGRLSLLSTLVVAAGYALWHEWSHINTHVTRLLPELGPARERSHVRGLLAAQQSGHRKGMAALAFQTTIEITRIIDWIGRVMVTATRAVLTVLILVLNRLHALLVRTARRVGAACVFTARAVVDGLRAVVAVVAHVLVTVAGPILLLSISAWSVWRASTKILGYLLGGPMSDALFGLMMVAVVCLAPLLAFALTTGRPRSEVLRAGQSAVAHFVPRAMVLFTCGAWVVGIAHTWGLSPIKVGPITIGATMLLAIFGGYALYSGRASATNR